MQKKRGKTNVGECSGFLYMQGVKSKPNQKRRYKKKMQKDVNIHILLNELLFVLPVCTCTLIYHQILEKYYYCSL